jgi:hypothetical protein
VGFRKVDEALGYSDAAEPPQDSSFLGRKRAIYSARGLSGLFGCDGCVDDVAVALATLRSSLSSPKPRFLKESGAMRFLWGSVSQIPRLTLFKATMHPVRLLPRPCDEKEWGGASFEAARDRIGTGHELNRLEGCRFDRPDVSDRTRGEESGLHDRSLAAALLTLPTTRFKALQGALTGR